MAGENWQERAACRGYPTSLFFLVDDEKPSERRDRERKAKALCARCEVVNDCLNAGREEFGIWGGLTERERSQHSSRVVLQRSEPFRVDANTEESGWVVIDTRGRAELWQRASMASWHGSEWAVFDGSKMVGKTFELSQAYFMFEKCYLGGV